MLKPSLSHFERAARELAAHGDNDTLPFDVDTKFCGDKATELAAIAIGFYQELRKGNFGENHARMSSMQVFSERLLAPSGPAGFRVVTKIQMFWCVYLNGLAIAIAESLEARRAPTVHSYRFLADGGDQLFDPLRSWRSFKQATVEHALSAGPDAIVVQTDISSFYDNLSHHHIENFITDLGDDGRVIAKQINAILSKFTAGRSFGLPVGGQSSRVLAELFLMYSDNALTAAGITWHRYVDDYVLIASSNADAYKALGILAQTLFNWGLTLNKSKTVLLSTKHYSDYVISQLGGDDSEAAKLRSIDLRFDPYSDTPDEDYESLRETVESLEVRRLLNREMEKSIPDTFLIVQIGRTMRLHPPGEAIELAATLLQVSNLHAFRSSWSTIMRGIAQLRSDSRYNTIHDAIDKLLDDVPRHSGHLLEVDTSLLHYLRCLRFTSTMARIAYLHTVFNKSKSETVRRACIDCWRHWKDRNSFTDLRNRWDGLPADSQRLLWLASYTLGDQGEGMRRQLKAAAKQSWAIGVEPRFEEQTNGSSQVLPRALESKFAELFMQWAPEAKSAI
ncbi:hypothetical protein BN2497_3803 [Janthinobacterium sp. CG23_2]|nr:hypothetical protein BN2497_3803 [Janthinobacterium sp. CG23_2]CUU28299.1 hypothetical protein BN3177_3803 [Janthinobacterium sp. CG23_2]